MGSSLDDHWLSLPQERTVNEAEKHSSSALFFGSAHLFEESLKFLFSQDFQGLSSHILGIS